VFSTTAKAWINSGGVTLIALMQDQVEALQANNSGATFLNSSLNSYKVRSRESAILNGKFNSYVAPERLVVISAFSGFSAGENWHFCVCD